MALTKEKLQIRLASYDSEALDKVAKRFKEILQKQGVNASGPHPLPTEKRIYTVLRSPHRHKDSREQFIKSTHKRVIIAENLTPNALNELSGTKIPTSVSITISVKSHKNKAIITSRTTNNMKTNK